MRTETAADERVASPMTQLEADEIEVLTNFLRLNEYGRRVLKEIARSLVRLQSQVSK